jgi:hypothetical protein
MICAIILDLYVIFLLFNNRELPDLLKLLSIFGTVAIVVHLIEGIIAGFLAKNQGKNILNSAIYTFFIGTIAFWELRIKDQQNQSKSVKIN